MTMVFIVMLILIILPIVCAEAPLNAGMTVNGEVPEEDSCESIRCAPNAGRKVN